MAVYLVAYDQQSRNADNPELFEVLRGLGAERILCSVFVVHSAGDAQGLHDGYFYFERVPPGHYMLRIDPDQAAKLGIRLLSDVVVKAGADGGLVSDLNVRIGRGSTIAEQKGAAPAAAAAATLQNQ